MVSIGAPVDAKDQLAALSQVRTAIATAVGAVLVVLTGLIAGRAALDQARVSATGLTTERFTKATELLGSDSIQTRAGAAYALERLAQDSAVDGGAIAELLCAFVRERSAQLLREAGALPEFVPPPHVHALPCNTHLDGSRQSRGRPDSLVVRAPDVAAAMAILGRSSPWRKTTRLELAAADLRNANLRASDLSHAYMVDACFEGGWLSFANLAGADLTNACLMNAYLRQADMTGIRGRGIHASGSFFMEARLAGASLPATDFCDANMSGAILRSVSVKPYRDSAGRFWPAARWSRIKLCEADLREAQFPGIDLQGADLTGTLLAGASLIGADMRGAKLGYATLVGTDDAGHQLPVTNLERTDLRGAILNDLNLADVPLTGAQYDSTTIWRLSDAEAQARTTRPAS